MTVRCSWGMTTLYESRLNGFTVTRWSALQKQWFVGGDFLSNSFRRNRDNTVDILAGMSGDITLTVITSINLSRHFWNRVAISVKKVRSWSYQDTDSGPTRRRRLNWSGFGIIYDLLIFGMMGLGAPPHVLYRYWLEGHDDGWSLPAGIGPRGFQAPSARTVHLPGFARPLNRRDWGKRSGYAIWNLPRPFGKLSSLFYWFPGALLLFIIAYILTHTVRQKTQQI